MAINHPVDIDIPESSLMLAVYLSVPEAESARRSLNTANGMHSTTKAGACGVVAFVVEFVGV